MQSKLAKAIFPACFKGRLERRVKRLASSYRGHSINSEQTGDWCGHCGVGILPGTDALTTQAPLLEWRAHVDKQKGD